MRRLLVVTAFGLCAVVAMAKPSVQSVELKASATVAGGTVTLGDIAVLQPAEAGAAAIEIGPAPLPGASRELAVGYVRLRMRKAGVDLKSVSFTGAEKVAVTREALQTAGAEAVVDPVVDVPASAAGGEVAATPAAPSRPSAPRPAALAQPRETVQRGSIFRLTLRSGGLSVDALGELLNPCAVGQIGKFRVNETRAMVAAMLVSDNTAEVIR